jgi:hypothetical protein
MKRIPWPSPNGTNYERRFFPADKIMAMDAAIGSQEVNNMTDEDYEDSEDSEDNNNDKDVASLGEISRILTRLHEKFGSNWQNVVTLLEKLQNAGVTIAEDQRPSARRGDAEAEFARLYPQAGRLLQVAGKAELNAAPFAQSLQPAPNYGAAGMALDARPRSTGLQTAEDEFQSMFGDLPGCRHL